jgi:DNA-binding XRE family transcriptional regulator
MEIYLYNKGLEGVLDIEQYCKDNNIDAEKIKWLSCHNNKLTQLKGLDKLVNLEMLFCNNNQLTELDLSNLVNLKEVYCYINNITELKGFEKLDNLRLLNCNDNKLKELRNVDKLENLTELYCSYNQITELDVGKLVNLRTLYCPNNKLVKLDATNLDNLENLNCINNKLLEIKGLNELINLRWLNDEKYKKPVIDLIKKQREAYGMTQKEFAIALGLSETNGDRYIREVESGRKKPSGLFIRCLELFVENEDLKNTC